MSVSSGFFNSKDGDRRYDAEQMSSIFDGMINDGVYKSVGEALLVKQSSGMNIIVSPGRAWFNHTWTLVDSNETLTVGASDVANDRIDAVVLEVNTTENVRQNSLKIVKGTPAAAPAKPSLTKSGGIYQYALAYITVEKGVTSITSDKIQINTGTADCPFVFGLSASKVIASQDDITAGSTALASGDLYLVYE